MTLGILEMQPRIYMSIITVTTASESKFIFQTSMKILFGRSPSNFVVKLHVLYNEALSYFTVKTA